MKMEWIKVNRALVKCQHCGAVQFKSRRCKCCKRWVTEEDIGLVDTVIEAEGDKKQDGESDN